MKDPQQLAGPIHLSGRGLRADHRAMSEAPTVHYETDGQVSIVTIDRPAARNAVNPPTARALAAAFRRFDADGTQHVAILTGAGRMFCAGYDLKATAAGDRSHRVQNGDGPMGP